MSEQLTSILTISLGAILSVILGSLISISPILGIFVSTLLLLIIIVSCLEGCQLPLESSYLGLTLLVKTLLKIQREVRNHTSMHTFS